MFSTSRVHSKLFSELRASPQFLTHFGIRSSLFLSSTSTSLHTWDDFFKIRSKIKKIGIATGIPSAFTFLIGESIFLSQPLFDPTMTIFGLDPMLVISLCTIGGTVVSFLVGSALGRFIYSSRYPNLKTFLDQKQRNFYERIVRYRANVPPIPTQPNLNMDFHGEKISSVAGYKKWLKRQSQFKPIRELLK